MWMVLSTLVNFWDFWRVCKVKTIFIILGRHHLLLSLSLSHKCVVNEKYIHIQHCNCPLRNYHLLQLSEKDNKIIFYFPTTCVCEAWDFTFLNQNNAGQQIECRSMHEDPSGLWQIFTVLQHPIFSSTSVRHSRINTTLFRLVFNWYRQQQDMRNSSVQVIWVVFKWRGYSLSFSFPYKLECWCDSWSFCSYYIPGPRLLTLKLFTWENKTLWILLRLF